jgi:uncharacterized oligopeptide transporter (OPT) family protein
VASSNYPDIVQWTLWPGVGLIFGGSVPGILAQLRRGTAPRGAGMRIPVGFAAAATIAVVLAGWLAFDLHPLLGTLALALSVVFAAGAMRSAAETDIAPCGPLGGVGQLVVGQLSSGGITTPLGAGAVVNGIVMQSATMLQNWKVGAILKTPPRAQLIASLAGIVVGAIATTLVFELLRRSYGYGSEALPSPDGVSWLATAQLVERGLDAFPAHAGLATLVGTVAGIVLALPRIARIAPSPIAFGIAFILPAYIAFTVVLGAIALWLLDRIKPAWTAANATSLGAGAIAGEAIMGLVIAAIAILR